MESESRYTLARRQPSRPPATPPTRRRTRRRSSRWRASRDILWRDDSSSSCPLQYLRRRAAAALPARQTPRLSLDGVMTEITISSQRPSGWNTTRADSVGRRHIRTPRAAQAFSRSCGTVAPRGDPDSTLRTVAPRTDPDSTAPSLPEGTLTVPFEPSLPEGTLTVGHRRSPRGP